MLIECTLLILCSDNERATVKVTEKFAVSAAIFNFVHLRKEVIVVDLSSREADMERERQVFHVIVAAVRGMFWILLTLRGIQGLVKQVFGVWRSWSRSAMRNEDPRKIRKSKIFDFSGLAHKKNRNKDVLCIHNRI